jgi:hypothetical protein
MLTTSKPAAETTESLTIGVVLDYFRRADPLDALAVFMLVCDIVTARVAALATLKAGGAESRH